MTHIKFERDAGIALMWTPLSIIGPLSGLTIITNSVLAMRFLGENASTLDLGATLIVVSGTVLTSAFGSHESPDYDAAALIGLFEHWYVALYYLCTFFILFGSALVLSWRKCPPWLDMFVFANIAGCLGGNQNAFLKCGMELLKVGMHVRSIRYYMEFRQHMDMYVCQVYTVSHDETNSSELLIMDDCALRGLVLKICPVPCRSPYAKGEPARLPHLYCTSLS